MRRQKPEGSWKKFSSRKRKFVALALKYTKVPMRDIAKRASFSAMTVRHINNETLDNTPIRTPEVKSEIYSNASKKKHEKKRRKKINAFSRRQKLTLIEKNINGISQLAAKWFFGKTKSSWLLRQEFGDFGNFIFAIKNYLVEQLDYFDPKLIAKRTGKPIKVFTYILGGAEIFCKHAVSEIFRKRKRGGVSKPGIWLDRNIKKLLKSIGFIPELYEGAVTPFEVIEQLRQLVKQNKIKLTYKMKRAILLLFDGYDSNEAGKKLGVTGEAVRQSKKISVKRIKEYFSRKK